MKAKLFVATALCAVFLFGTAELKAQGKPYKDGSVWSVTMVRTKPGTGNDYLKSLKSNLKVMYEDAIKQGLILSYKIMQGPSANREDFDILIMVEYKNMAATEGHDDQWEAIRNKAIGGEAQERTLMKDRLEIREILGDKLMREVIL